MSDFLENILCITAGLTLYGGIAFAVQKMATKVKPDDFDEEFHDTKNKMNQKLEV